MNELAESLLQQPPKAEIRATDPTALSGKQKDINLLRTRKIWEDGANKANRTIGDPPVKMDLSKAKSNIGQFDKLGLDTNDQDDLSVFEMYLQRMNYEVAAQSAINGSMKANTFDELRLREYLFDIGAANACCTDVYVDAMTGAQVIQRIMPEDARGLFGASFDGHDDIAKGWERNMPLRDFLGLVGDAFDFERDWVDLIWALNYANNQSYTGFRFNGFVYDTWGIGRYEEQLSRCNCNGSNICEWNLNQTYAYKVYGGKCQVYVPDVVYAQKISSSANYNTPALVNYQEFIKQVKQTREYDVDCNIKWKSYDALFLATTTTTQKVYKWGETYLQQPEGANDEYCIGTLKYYRLSGKTIAEVAEKYLEVADELFLKFKWILFKAKPRARNILFNEFVGMARYLKGNKDGMIKKDGTPSTDVNALLEDIYKFQEEHVDVNLRFYPRVEGRDIPQLPSMKADDEGLDPLAEAFQGLMDWAERQVADKIGLNDLRMAQIRNAREGVKQQELQTEFSKNQTNYIYRLIQYLKKDTATTLLLYCHDVIKYKESMGCKWLKNLLGDEDFKGLEGLGDVAPHRLSIFINDYNTAKRKQQIDEAANIALQKGTQGLPGGITLEQWYAVTSAEDYRKEMKLLAIFIKKEDKKVQARAVQKMQAEQQHQKEMEILRRQTIKEKFDGELAVEKEKSAASKYVADKSYAAKYDVKELTIQNEPEKQGQRVAGQQQLANTKHDLKQQEAFS